MKNLLLFAIPLILIVFACGSDEEIQQDVLNTENSILITGINESISYTYSSANGRTETSVPEDVKMIQILILNDDNEIVYEQYHYNQNAYNEYYYDSAHYGGDDYMFENTLPDTLYIPSLEDGTYTILASTSYAYYYDHYYYGDSASMNYPFIESYQVSDGPIFVGKASTEVTEDTDQVVEIDMTNISARIDLNITSSIGSDWNLEVHIETNNSTYYSFESESLMPTEYDHSYLYLWRDYYWNQPSYYFLPRNLRNVQLYFYDYGTGFNVNFESEIDPELTMNIGDVFTLNIDLDELIKGGGTAGFSWEDIDWNEVGDVTIP